MAKAKTAVVDPFASVPEPPPQQRTPRLKKEVHTGEMPMGQPEPIVMPGLGVQLDPAALNQPVELVEKLEPNQAKNLAFNEEPITIIIMPSNEEFAPKHQFCAVNGKGAEVLERGHWIPCLYLAVDTPLTTKRKYVEALCMSRKVTMRTDVNPHYGEDRDPENRLSRISTPSCTFSVIEDKNPKGVEWLRRLMAAKY